MPAYPVVSETDMTTTTETLGWFVRFRWYRASLSVVGFFGGLVWGLGLETLDIEQLVSWHHECFLRLENDRNPWKWRDSIDLGS